MSRFVQMTLESQGENCWTAYLAGMPFIQKTGTSPSEAVVLLAEFLDDPRLDLAGIWLIDCFADADCLEVQVPLSSDRRDGSKSRLEFTLMSVN